MFGANILQSLTARPPTPPRDTQIDEIDRGLDQAIEFLNDAFIDRSEPSIQQNIIRRSDTPERTPSSSSEQLTSSRVSTSTTRKVNFAPFIQWDFHNSPVHPPTVHTLPVKPLAPSRNRFSHKSILKPFKMTTVVPTVVRPYDTLQAMLEETVDILREGDIATRANAYGSCLHTLQDFDSFPDTQSLAEHSNHLLHFIRSDMETEMTADPSNLKLAVSAIKLLIAMIRLPESAAWFDTDKMAGALEFSISVIQSATAPKTILTHHLFFLSQQKFGPRLMTADRVSRTITALTTIHERIPGNGVRAHRLLIYRRFVDQCPTVMRARAGDWIVNLYTSILSQKRDVREQGMELGYTTALKFGNHAEISRMVQELLDKEFDKKSFGTYAIERLQDLLKQKDVCVPRIWAITVLFLRGRNKKENHWTWFKPWLELASSCVNSTDKQIKIETIMAWRKLIFACMPDMQTLKAVRNLLKAPIEAHLKKEQDFTKGLGKYAMSTYFSLLHYSLRPGIMSEQLDSYWDEYVAQILTKFVSRSDENVYYACSILQSMFRMRALLGVKPIKTTEDIQFDFEEPPTLEPRWIRSRLPKILSLVDVILLNRASWMPVDDERLDNTAQNPDRVHSLGLVTWMSLMDAVREAGLMEVTTSFDLKRAIAAVVNSLHQLNQSFRNLDTGSFASSHLFASLVQGTLERLGAAHFAERMLMRTSNDAFEVAPTPSQRSKAGGSLSSPMTHLFILQFSLQSSRETPHAHLERVKSTVLLCWNALKNRNMKLDMLGDLAEALEAYTEDNGAMSDLQQDVADLLLELSEDTVLSSGAHLVSQPGMSSSDITALLRILRHLTSFLTANRIPRILYAHLVKAARTISGDGGVLLLVTEPQSSSIAEWMTSNKTASPEMLLSYATMIIENDTRPRLGSMERARKQIWGGVSGTVDKFQDADLVHTNIWNLFDATLRYGYAHLGEAPSIATALTEFLDAMQRHIRRSLRSFHTLVKFIQNALATILLDEHRKLKDISRTSQGSKLLLSILSLWTEISDKYRSDFKVASPASNWLDTVQDLLLAGFNSPRESIVNVTITFWNDFVALACDLLLNIDYPDRLINAALCLRSIGDVHIPPGHIGKENEIGSNDRTFVAFSDYGSQPSSTPLAVRSFGPPNHQKLLSPMPIKQAQHKLRSPASRLTPRRKLRHEDSQIVFEPIANSSPLRSAEETQHLTDHQKEVLERQQDQAAALFRDIGSDDIGHSSRNLVINSDVAVASSDTGKDNASRPSTPDVTGPDGPEEEVQSSPITASQSRRQNRSSSSNPSASASMQELNSSPPAALKMTNHVDAAENIQHVTTHHDETMLDSVQYPQDLLETLPDIVPDTMSEEQAASLEQTNDEQPASEDNIGGYRISSDDLPSSQLVAEMLASQSSPIPSVEDGEAKMSTSPSTLPEEGDNSHSTASLMRAQTTLDDLFPTSFVQSSDIAESDSQESQYQTRSRTARETINTSTSRIDNNSSLKRKRGRPKKQSIANGTAAQFEPRSTGAAAAETRGRRSSSRLSSSRLDHIMGEVEALSSSNDTDDCDVVQANLHLGSAEEQPMNQGPSLKRQKSDSGAALPAFAAAEENDIATPQSVDIPVQEDDTVETRPMLTPKSILARLQSLIADAKSMVWSREEQLEIGDLSFELQAATRGYVKAASHDQQV